MIIFGYFGKKSCTSEKLSIGPAFRSDFTISLAHEKRVNKNKPRLGILLRAIKEISNQNILFICSIGDGLMGSYQNFLP